MFTIRDETPADIVAREALLDTCFGDGRFAKTSERLREGRLPANGLAFTAVADNGSGGSTLIGTVRLWNVSAGRQVPALLLGPLAVDPARQSGGLGGALMRHAIGRAAMLGHRAILLVGDAPYYARFGFCAEAAETLWMPGPFARERFLALELERDALKGAHGVLRATGERVPAVVADLAQAA